MYPHILIYVYVVINLNCYTLSRYVDPLEPGLLFGWPAVNPFFSKKSLTKRRDLVRSCRWLVGAIPRPWWCWDHHPEGKRSLKTLGFCNHVMNNSLSGKSNSIQHSVYIYIYVLYIYMWYMISNNNILYYNIAANKQWSSSGSKTGHFGFPSQPEPSCESRNIKPPFVASVP